MAVDRQARGLKACVLGTGAQSKSTDLRDFALRLCGEDLVARRKALGDTCRDKGESQCHQPSGVGPHGQQGGIEHFDPLLHFGAFVFTVEKEEPLRRTLQRQQHLIGLLASKLDVGRGHPTCPLRKVFTLQVVRVHATACGQAEMLARTQRAAQWSLPVLEIWQLEVLHL